MALSFSASCALSSSAPNLSTPSHGSCAEASRNFSRIAALGAFSPAREWSNSVQRSSSIRSSSSTNDAPGPIRSSSGLSSGSSAASKRSGSEAVRGSKKSWALQATGLPNEVLEAKGLTYDGPGRGGEWLSSTTRHVRIYIGVADPVSKLMDQTQLDKITLMLDPDNEFVWPEDKVNQVYDYFSELVDAYEGAPMTEYTLRLIGSDVEHYIRKMLLGNEIKYNLNCRVLNFSMGKPRYESGIIEEGED